MLARKKEIKRLDALIEELQKSIQTLNNRQELLNDCVECSVCGCLLKKRTALKGVGEIRKKFVVEFYMSWEKDYIFYPYYCKIHKPEKLNASTPKKRIKK